MTLIDAATAIPPDIKAELQQAADRLARRERDPEAAKLSAAQMDRMREENRRLFGVQNIGVEIIREMRDSRW